MPNNYLSVLYKLIIKVENENVGLKVGGGGGGGAQTYHCPPIKKVEGGAHAPPPPPLPTSFITKFITWVGKHDFMRGSAEHNIMFANECNKFTVVINDNEFEILFIT